MPKKLIFLCSVLLVLLACDSSRVVNDVLTALPLTETPAVVDQTGTVEPPSTNPDEPTEPATQNTTPPALQVGYEAHGSFYDIYFTDPFNADADREEGGPDVPLIASIDSAQVSIDVAAYSMSLRSVRDALLRAKQRGVEVRMVMESENMDGAVPKALMDAEIPIIGDNRPGLMHDKFMVIDRTEVWAGSMNFTTSGTYHDNNNLIHIRSEKVAQDYTVEFEEMFKRDFFGKDVIAQTPNPHINIDGTQMEVYFSPDDKVAKRIVELLRGAQHSITFMAYSFTAADFGKIIIQKAKQGLDVHGVMETEQIKSNKNTEFSFFEKANLPVYKDGNDGQMHHKVFIIDESIVITGSYNFSFSAETNNDENVMIFFSPEIAAQYLAEFARVDAEAQK